MKQIADETGYSMTTIHKYIHKYGIKAKPSGVSYSKKDWSKLITKEWLYHQYIELNKSYTDIEKEFGIDTAITYNYIHKFDITSRKAYIIKDLIGQTFGKLTVISPAPSRNGNTHWLCQCTCGNKKEVAAANLLNGNTTSCGCYGREQLKIAQRAKAIARRQEQDYEDLHALRETFEYTEFRKAVLKRDNYKCTITGETKDLQVHHLDSFKNFPDKRTDVDNGVTITKDMHKLIHKMYGRFTKKEDFISFIKFLMVAYSLLTYNRRMNEKNT